MGASVVAGWDGATGDSLVMGASEVGGSAGVVGSGVTTGSLVTGTKVAADATPLSMGSTGLRGSSSVSSAAESDAGLRRITAVATAAATTRAKTTPIRITCFRENRRLPALPRRVGDCLPACRVGDSSDVADSRSVPMMAGGLLVLIPPRNKP